MNETKLREEICWFGKSMFDRGLTAGSSGNISARSEDGTWLMTPTNTCLGRLDPARLSKVSAEGALISGDKPTKEAFLHLSMYAERPAAGAVVHLHSTHSVAVSVLADVDPGEPIPPITAYYVMKVGRLALLPYYAPGDLALADAVREVAGKHHAVLLANHGPVVAGRDLETAVYATEELEETAKLYLMLRGNKLKILTPVQVEELGRKYPS
ncbi:MAG TPA: 3-oxo-tetronate 4-phosphate decarboxylase [Burkholderiales bacterium]|jgi:ribulose-5-phosphate 4-epimerase/fuculose-1-phosphate aldolase|nr:3-oxo-tetronate 4-phosphate decarboxylase [Burkholderiales bacterium]